MLHLPSRPAPLAAVAAAAGVSVPTVSKVLNNRRDVSAATRAKVLVALQQHGHHIAERRRRPTHLIDIRILDVEGTWSEAVVRGAATEARARGYDVALTVDPDPEDCGRWVNHAIDRGTDGLISVVTVPGPASQRQFDKTHTPVVVVDPRRPTGRLLTVGATNFHGALKITTHLLELGHQRIATITGSLEQDNALARLAGFRAAHFQAGIAVDDDLVKSGDFGITAGYNATTQLLTLTEPPTAIFAASDDMAMGALHALRSAGLRVPDDVSVAGFDGLPFTPWLDPPLTTVCQPMAHMGAVAVQMIVDTLSGSREVVPVELATQLAVRASTAPPRPAR